MRSQRRTTVKNNTRRKQVKFRSMFECSGSKVNHNKGIYLGDVLVGVVVCGTRNWCVWRLISKCNANERIDGHVRMYVDRMERVGGFETWQEARDCIMGPLSDILLEEIRPIGNVNTDKGIRYN